MRSRLLVVLAALAAGVSLAAPGSAAPPWTPEAQYTLAGTVVVKQANEAPIADEGVLVCRPGQGMGVGGGCISFGAGPGFDSVRVVDAQNDHQVAFQVCIDNNGDGVCVSPDNGPCADQVFFSHADDGAIFNPLGPLPTRHSQECPGGVWDGYVVFLCNGVHDAGRAHTHPATTGSIMLSGDGSGFGNFCGGTPVEPTRKRYAVVN